MMLARAAGRLTVGILGGALLLLGTAPGEADRAGGAGPTRPGISPDSILASARILSGETGLGPPSRVARRPSTDLYSAWLRDRLRDLLEPLGGTAYFQAFDPGFDDRPPVPTRDVYRNVIGVLPGVAASASVGMFLMGAHYDATSSNDAVADTTWDPMTASAPGADDNASGVVAILEALRVMSLRGIRPQADLMIAFFDGEEQQAVYSEEDGRFGIVSESLFGSNVLVDSLLGTGRTLHGFVNLDMVAYNPRADSLVVLSNITSRWLADQALAARERTLAPGDLDLVRVVRGFTFSDQGPFWAAGFDAILLIESTEIPIHARGHYHRSTDTVDLTYSRGGAQVARAAAILLGLLESWSWSPEDSAAAAWITGEDILVGDATHVDFAEVRMDQPVEVTVGATNRGGTALDAVWDIGLRVETTDGEVLEDLGFATVRGDVPAGGRVAVGFPWTPSVEERGAVRLTAWLDDGSGVPLSGSRVQAVRGEPRSVAEAYVFPNPVRDPASATLSYELSWEGSVRIGIIDVSGRVLVENDIRYSAGTPFEGTEPGLARVPLSDVLRGTRLPPGLHFVRVELFPPEGGSADVAVGRFVVVR